ncbi:MAG TPA: AFG1/ZapE family ATPase, partial [Gammaproteobacteria bacterium]|nr:AFG1/ZapE family ATPase [Gammaproteobacteria bacterium]
MPDKIYQADLKARNITLDKSQQLALTHFARLHHAVLNHQGWRSFLQRLPKGIYCHGPVGRGKTLLMDLFFDHLSPPSASSSWHGSPSPSYSAAPLSG